MWQFAPNSVHYLLSLCLFLPVDVAVRPKQRALPPQSVAANGGLRALRESLGASPVGNLHSGGDQGIHNLEAGVRSCCY